MKVKKWLSTGLAMILVLGVMTATGCGASKESSTDTFSWWIYKDDNNGLYNSYNENPSVQWLQQQTWDVEHHTISEDGSGKTLKFEFETPISGSETDNFNTMMSTGEYTDILDMCVSPDNAKTLYEEGITLELTEYIEKYCPNYVAFLEKNPDLKKLVSHEDDEGKTHYYSIGTFKDGNDVPWEGYVYRRDWVVKYCRPTEYVWDWDSGYVKENGHPAVTPLEKAQQQGNLEGWKKNPVSSFQVLNDGGEDPNNKYEDNVIFPSGTKNPLTISDWEWMFEGFKKAIEERGWVQDSNAYCTTVMYSGFSARGDLVSSFNGGNGYWVKDTQGNVSYSGTSEGFRTYIETLHHWYEKGWLDKAFTTRASDQFYQINQAGHTTGRVGMWVGYGANLGNGIRATCINEEDAKDAYVMGCALPINDMYGTEKEMYHQPDALYQGGRLDGQIVITKQAEEKDLDVLFTFFNWLFTREGSLAKGLGLTKEQLQSVDIESTLYEDNGFDCAYTVEKDEEGKDVYRVTYDGDIGGNLCFARLAVGLNMTGVGEGIDYVIDRNYTRAYLDTIEEWGRYTSTANVADYEQLLSNDENQAYTKMFNVLKDYEEKEVPEMIKEGTGTWDEFVRHIEKYKTEEISGYFEKYIKE